LGNFPGAAHIKNQAGADPRVRSRARLRHASVKIALNRPVFYRFVKKPPRMTRFADAIHYVKVMARPMSESFGGPFDKFTFQAYSS